tara:strand:+ start:893 stop:1351 length:459 start_codon:yes stop_codon:yes gene_type:complete
MKHIFYITFIFFFITNCTLNKVIKHHGVHFLENKHSKLKINSSNINDIILLLGPPSTKSTFDKDLWIYIERTTSSSKITKLGKSTLLKNNVLILEINNKGLLSEKIFLNKENMNKVNFSKDFTKMTHSQQTFLYDFLSSIRQKIKDPLGKNK